jgi:hypothetical protein
MVVQIYVVDSLQNTRMRSGDRALAFWKRRCMYSFTVSDVVSFIAFVVMGGDTFEHVNLVKFTLVHHPATLESNHRRRHRHQYVWFPILSLDLAYITNG